MLNAKNLVAQMALWRAARCSEVARPLSYPNALSRRTYAENSDVQVQQQENRPHRRHRGRGRRSDFDMLPRFLGEFPLLSGFPGFDLSDPFEPLTTTVTDWNPRSDITETKDSYMITTELPGVPKDDIHIDVQDNVLTIHGEKKEEEEREDQEKRYYRKERRYGSFTRSFTLPEGIKPEEVKAKYDSGILKVTIPRKDQPQESHKVTIDVESKEG